MAAQNFLHLWDSSFLYVTPAIESDLTARSSVNLGPLPNFGYYMPWSRYLVIGSHVTTALTFAGTETSRAANMRDDGGRIQPAFDGDVRHFLNNLLSTNSLEAEPVLKEVGPEKAEPLNLAGVAGWLLSLFNVFG